MRGSLLLVSMMDDAQHESIEYSMEYIRVFSVLNVDFHLYHILPYL